MTNSHSHSHSQDRFPFRLSSTAGLLLLVAASAIFSGCDHSDGVAVEGVVSYKGHLLTSGLVNFLSAGHKPFGSSIQSDGTYRCEVPSGTYQVVILVGPEIPEGWQEGDRPPPITKPQLPAKYGSAKTSRLKATVAEDSKLIDFKLP